jgi:hypothetical protein
MSIGWRTLTETGGGGISARDAQTTSETRSITETANIVNVISTSTVHDWIASWVSFDATGYTINVNDASPVDRIISGFAIEDPTELVSNDTENISDTAVLAVTIQRRVSNDTENISDSPRLLVTIDRRVSNDTEQLSDNAVLAVTINRRVVAEVEQIGDDFAVVRKEAIGDTEQITDAAILVPGTFASFPETEQIIDSLVTVLQASMGATIFGDVEDISDAAVLSLRTAFVGFSETERISDQALLYLGRVMVVNEIVDILDGFAGGGSGGLHAIKLKRAGRVFQW